MKKLILLLVSSLTCFLGYGQTAQDTAVNRKVITQAGNGQHLPMLAAFFNDKRPTRSNYYLLSGYKRRDNDALLTSMGMTSFALTQGTGITAFTYDGSAAATVAINQAFSPTWTGLHTFNNAVSGTNYGVIFSPAQAASSNNQVETAMHIAPTYSDGSFTGAVHTPLAIDWDGTAHLTLSNVTGTAAVSFHAASVPTTTNYFLKQEGTSVYLNAPTTAGAVGFRLAGTTAMTLNTSGLSINSLAAGMLYSNGGTLTRIANGTSNQLLGMTSAATGYEYKTVSGNVATGTVVTNGTGTITLSNDTTKLQTVANFFPKGDTRYLRSVTGLAAGGDLSGTYPNPTVVKFNGQLPSYYLNYANLTGKPTTLSAFTNDLGLGTGTVSSVGLTGSNGVIVGGTSPVTGSGTFALQVDSTKYQTIANFFPKADTRYLKNINAISAGGDLSGSYPNPTVAKFNGQLPAYYLSYSNLTGKPTNVSTFTNDAGYLTALTGTQITTALGYTPYDAANPSGYLTAITGTQVMTALGYTPYNAATNPSGYLTAITGTQITTALGYTPYNGATNPSGYLTAVTGTQVGTALGYTAANDNTVVHLAGTETITGAKSFTGTIGIGTSTIPAGYQFAINGNTIVSSITVKAYSNWPDFVFYKDYKLKPLTEVADFINRNHHLPDIPTRQEVAKDGQNLGEMNEKLLKKVEELTLYMIEKDKQLKDQNAIIDAQEERLKKIEKQLNIAPEK